MSEARLSVHYKLPVSYRKMFDMLIQLMILNCGSDWVDFRSHRATLYVPKTF